MAWMGLQNYSASQIDETLKYQAQAIKEYKTSNILPAIVQRKATITGLMQCLLCYAGAFGEVYGKRFVHFCIVDMVEDYVCS